MQQHILKSKPIVYFVLLAFFGTSLMTACSSSRPYWKQVSQEIVPDKTRSRGVSYELRVTQMPSRVNPRIGLALYEKTKYASKEITREQKYVDKTKRHLGYTTLAVLGMGYGVGSSIAAVSGVDGWGDNAGQKVLVVVLGALITLGSYVGFNSEKTIKKETVATDEYRNREENASRTMETAWQHSRRSFEVEVQVDALERPILKTIVNGRLELDCMSELGIGLNEPIADVATNIQIQSDEISLDQTITILPSHFLKPYLKITRKVDNIRSGPGVNYKTIQKCHRGELYPIKEFRGNWCEVEIKKRTSWIHKSNGRIVYAQPYRLDKAGPPDLVAKVYFSEPSGNGRLDAEETATLTLRIQNNGKSLGYQIAITPNSLTNLNNIKIDQPKTVGRIGPNEIKEVIFEMTAGLNLNSSTEKIRFDFTEYNGFQPQPLFVSFETKAFEPPNLQIVDIGIDDASGNGQIEQGELAKITARVQNTGYGKAKEVRAQLELGANVYLAAGSKKVYDLGTLDYNELQDISFSIYTNNLITGEIPITLSVAESRGKYGTHKNLGLVVNQRQRLTSEFVFEGTEEERENLMDVTGLSIDIEKNIPKTSNKNPEAVALIVGISDYQKAGIPKVRYAKRDAYWVREYVEKVLGFEPYRILPKNPEEVMTAGNLKTYVRRVLPALVRDGESDVLVYYSGHGAPNVSKKSAYLVPYDCDPNFVNEDNAYRLDQFYSDLVQINSKSLTIVIDACFSGYARDGEMVIRQASPLFIKVENPIISAQNAVLFSSSALDQISNWYPQMKHGMFTYFFLKGLRGDADSNSDGEITVGEMEAYLVDDRNGVPYWSQAEFLRKQVPQVLGDKDRVLVNFR